MILHNQKWQLTTKVPDSCRLIGQMNTDEFINRPVMKRKLKQCVALILRTFLLSESLSNWIV